MRNRERLAADLRELHPAFSPVLVAFLAKRLIALGWSQFDEIDEERLARALARERVLWTSEEGGPKPERLDRKRAAAIAKAYREDTDE